MTDINHRSSAETHAYNYFRTANQPLRPAPPRIVIDPIWTPPRRTMLTDWIDDVDIHEHPSLPLLQDHFWQGDRFMDPVVADFRAMGPSAGRRMLDTALAHGITAVTDPPPSLIALFEHLDHPPAWYDPVKWEMGRRMWNNTSMSARFAMAIQDAMGTFVGTEVSTAVGITGRFVNDLVRRNVETAQWFCHVTKPGALNRDREEFMATVHVRLMHSQVRLAILNSWDADEYAHHGNPISTAMTMIAGLTFGLIPVLFDHRCGRRATWDELDAVTHYWAYISYVLGADPAIIPYTASDALAMMNYGVATAGGPSRWTPTMTEAAIEGVDVMGGPRGLLTRAALTPVAGALAFFSGEPLVRALFAGTRLAETPLQPFRMLTGLAVRTDLTIRKLDDTLPGAQWRRARRARRGDRFEGAAYRLALARARRLGIQADYTQHDKPQVPGCPASAG
ncbi:oxygenase MpaB family protein [Arthrobacter sp. SLBN-53]|uniref:oxygenase MpaB family protein n=1 Tax=Arthrobacter sp. SLBN-53 TaxID=2768412 RepID=UPI00114EFCEB|nr:oxygenase MpaB family protein [Arthrobacter sp. SLBN-53]TQK32051.1 uncharacterized protein DUF2236 [Arthrobacter sp. SLBN-53]